MARMCTAMLLAIVVAQATFATPDPLVNEPIGTSPTDTWCETLQTSCPADLPGS